MVKILKSEVHLFPDYWRVTDAAGELVGLLNPRTADLYDMVEVVDEMIESPPTPPTVDGTSYAPSTKHWEGYRYEWPTIGEYADYLNGVLKGLNR